MQIIGICGGYQMLGRKIFDPQGIEGPYKEVKGLGLLDIETVFEKGKTTCQVEAEISGFGDWGSGIGSIVPSPSLIHLRATRSIWAKAQEGSVFLKSEECLLTLHLCPALFRSP